MKAFVISLSKIPTSAASSQRVVRELEDFGLDAQLFEGTYGHEAPEIFARENRELAPISAKQHEIDPEYAKLAMRLGVMGCFHSHYRLWQKCHKINQPILIFEDDVIFERGFIPVEWHDVLLLATGKQAWKRGFFHDRIYNPTGQPQAGRIKGKQMPGGVGYGITPQGAGKLVKTYEKYFLPADNAMNFRVVSLQCHTYLMGRAAVNEDNKKSLTKSRMWLKMRDED